MSGTSLQTCKPITDVAALVRGRIEEEALSSPLALGSLKVKDFAELLGGQARHPQWIGKGWRGEMGGSEDALDPQGVAVALSSEARKSTKVFAWSFVIHTPKGVSLLAASDPEIRKWFFGGVSEMMAEEYMRVLEEHTVIRRGDGGPQKIPVDGLKGWWVGHAASAGGDPHLHDHLIVSATAQTADGWKGQIDGDKLMASTAKLADGSARRVLAREMAKIGLGFGLDGEVVGVERELVEKASTGRNAVKAIQGHFAAEGTPISDTQAWHHWRQIAEGKADKGLPQSLVASIRLARGEELGAEAIEHALDAAWAEPEKAKLVGEWLANKYGVEREDWDAMSADAREAWAQYPVYDDVTKVVALMATLPRAPKPEAVAGICARFADDAARPALMDAVAADPRVLVGQKHWVLRAQLEREEAVIERATLLLARTKADTSIYELLTDTQGASVVVISGVAGGGKSSALAQASEKWSDEGVTVWATARNRLTATETGRATGAEEEQALCTAALRQRIAARSWNTPEPGDVLVVDEFGLLDSADVEMIMALAESGVRIKALGDAHQIQPIDGSTNPILRLNNQAKSPLTR